MLAREIDQRDRETCQIALFVTFGIFTLSQYTHLHCRLTFYCQQNYARYLVFSYGVEFMSFLKHLTYYRKTDVSLNFLHQHNYGGLFCSVTYYYLLSVILEVHLCLCLHTF